MGGDTPTNTKQDSKRPETDLEWGGGKNACRCADYGAILRLVASTEPPTQDPGADDQPSPRVIVVCAGTGCSGTPPGTSINQQSDGRRTLTTEELAHFLNVSIKTVRRMVTDGQIPYLPIRSHRRFHLPDVINSLSTGGPHAKKTKGLGPRLAHGPVQEERNRTALLEHPEDGRWTDDLCSAGHDAQGRGHRPVPRGDGRGWERISVRRPLGEKK